MNNTKISGINKEIDFYFKNSRIPRLPWKLISMGDGKYQLCDQDGLILFDLSPNKDSNVNVSELSGARQGIENGIYWLSRIREDYDAYKNELRNTRDEIVEVRNLLNNLLAGN